MRCLLQAGSLILSEGGGAVGQMLRHLSGLVVQSPRGDIARGSGSTWTHLLVDACLCVGDSPQMITISGCTFEGLLEVFHLSCFSETLGRYTFDAIIAWG